VTQLIAVTELMNADMRRGMVRYGLTEARVRVVWELGHARDFMTQRQLADALEVSPRNVTTLIDSLETTGFVSRTAHPTDRRAIVVVLTPKGLQSFAQLDADMTEFADRLLGDLGQDDLDAFRRILDSVGAHLAALARDEQK
jgi:DNA-binding MarR family transcriptional regulator